jgi:hypothetical protein
MSYLSTLYQGKGNVDKLDLPSFLVMAAFSMRREGMPDVLNSCGKYG